MDRAPNSQCQFCTEGHPGDAGGSYDRKRCEADHWERQILDLTQRRADLEGRRAELQTAVESCDRHLAEHRKKLEAARYVGD
jgi:chromosome segregation ATPase